MILFSYFRTVWLFVTADICSLRGENLGYNDLHQRLTNNYSKSMAPKPKGIVVKILTYLYQLVQFDEVTGMFAVSGFNIIRWHDSRLTWNKSGFNEISEIVLPDTEIWLPRLAQIVMYDKQSSSTSYLPNTVRVDSGGHVTWHYADLFVTSCAVNLKYFPLDNQKCTLVFTPWGFFTDEIDLQPVKDHVEFQFFEPTGVWNVTSGKVVSFRKTDSSINKSQSYYEIQLVVQRGPMFYVLFFDLPMVLMEIVHLFVFVLPPESGERVGYSISVLLSVAVYLTIFTDNMPFSTSSRLPLLAWKLFFDLVISCWIMIWVVIISRIYNYPSERRISKFLKIIGSLANRVTCRKTAVSWHSVGKSLDILIGFVTLVLVIASDMNMLIQRARWLWGRNASDYTNWNDILLCDWISILQCRWEL